MAEDPLYLQLHKLTAIKSEDALDHILSTLWKTRKTGLSSTEKSHFQSLLDLPSLSQLDPVLACLRSLIRKCVSQNFTGDDLLKLFPPDLPLDLQSILVLSFQKIKERWKEDISKEQHLSPGTSVSNQVRTNVSPSFTSFPSSEMSTSSWQHQDPLARLNHNDSGISVPLAEINGSGMSACLQSDSAPSDISESLPRLKSMSWTLENHSAVPADKVAIISLKLQDYSKSPLGETEVKFKLTRDTLEAMLRSMTYIGEQLSGVVYSVNLLKNGLPVHFAMDCNYRNAAPEVNEMLLLYLPTYKYGKRVGRHEKKRKRKGSRENRRENCSYYFNQRY